MSARAIGQQAAGAAHGQLEMTDWATLKQSCIDHDTTLALRCETFGAQYRFSLSAKDRLDKIIYDARANDDGRDPQDVIAGLVTYALGNWWKS